ncbi:hypothetical protein [Acidovorax sp. SUPP2825]|uniref:hypothetical protein n=1 Tax=Acidovorax sp. SUPP2825 TaxID=2920879 RepID=UPI0023DE23C9|nr:hypothetical protein [Acidovorax sp. SUPP2825]GKS97023.1 hypothetical protein AVAK2825_20830 [Acidovorax sp. SUPP2825]
MATHEKHCNKCGEDWPADLEFFYSNPRTTDGLAYCCKACYREQVAAVPRRQTVASASPHMTDCIAPLLAGPARSGSAA